MLKVKAIPHFDPIGLFDSKNLKLSKLFNKLEVPVVSSVDRVRPEFLIASESQQSSFLDKIDLYIDLLEISSSKKIDVMKDQQFLWNAFGRIKVSPTNEIFEMITPGDAVEVYDSKGVQLFSNFEFSSIVSYSFQDLCWYSWSELFGRDEKHNKAISQEFAKCFSGAKGSFKPKVDDHLCWELKSETKVQAMVAMKRFCPIFGFNQKPRAMIATSKISLLI